MLLATWVLAIATAILALSGPVALSQWRRTREQENLRDQREQERRKREHEENLKNGILKTADENATAKFIPRDWVSRAAPPVVVVSLVGLLLWCIQQENRRNGEQN